MATEERQRGRKWMTIRARYLREHPLCVECERKGFARPATQLDHIVALVNGGTDDESNYQGLCDEHHKAKTAKDLGRTRRPQIGLDGWPIG